MKFYRLLIILLSAGLFACSSTTMVKHNTMTDPIAPTVAAYLKAHPEALQNLQGNNIKLLQLGDYDRFVLPSISVFGGLGDRIQTSMYPLLNQIIAIVQAVPKESITIQAYTFSNGPDDIAIKVTNLQAQAVGNYLMSHGVDTRLIYSIGMGHRNQVTASPDRLLENYRIEITLEELKTRLPG